MPCTIKKKNLILLLVIPAILFVLFQIPNIIQGNAFFINEEEEIDKALFHYHSGNYSKALENIDFATKINNSNPFSSSLKSVILYKLYNYEESVISADRAILLNDRNSEAYLTKELCLIRMGIKEKGISYIINPDMNYSNSDFEAFNREILYKVNLPLSDPDNADFWIKWNRLNLWEAPGSSRYVGTTNACSNVEIFITGMEVHNNETYYRIKESNRDLEGWI
ncbi:hypothetical protein F1737_04035 [Methanoplanus sp. FWC-SCC4]|uniref:Uncharacterized protein n=1 Tax=Methanochimaera problematica TaxID=2609417 RepID=A0AA97FBJ8_9EURY|nr:hypothetical protein [Methanoplanus sp. FWC-SCC4]WOF15924.1 hypothetical protein F1737_04035 [Methanoplanus sp. FWC-SCC4]